MTKGIEYQCLVYFRYNKHKAATDDLNDVRYVCKIQNKVKNQLFLRVISNIEQKTIEWTNRPCIELTNKTFEEI